MLKVMIVDDEPVIRFGIKASVDWEKEGMRVIGDYANGAEALERMKSESVDILITDIKMPIMDGLELSRQALQLNPILKIVLVSSHNDFEYVRQGLKLGAVDYILKHTLEPEELQLVVQKCAQLIYKEARLQSKLEDALDSELARRRKKHEQELKHYLVHPEEKLKPGSLPEWLTDEYLGVYVVLNRVHALGEAYGYLYISIVQEQCMEAFYRMIPRGIAVKAAENELFLLIPSADLSEERLPELKIELETEIGLTISFGYDRGREVRKIPECFVHGKEAAERDFFEGDGIYRYGMLQHPKREGTELPALLKGLPLIVEKQFEDTVNRWKSDWSSGGITPLELKGQASRVLSMLFKDSADPYALVEAFDCVYKSETFNELCDHVMEQFSELKRSTAANLEAANQSNPVDKAVTFIHLHYLEPITLQQAADEAHVSKNYFSILFKKTTGQNFIDYVIDLRMMKAKDLLAGSDLKIYGVAEQSGFNDVKYFSKLFKKMTGLSPVDYREYCRMNHHEPRGGEAAT